MVKKIFLIVVLFANQIAVAQLDVPKDELATETVFPIFKKINEFVNN